MSVQIGGFDVLVFAALVASAVGASAALADETSLPDLPHPMVSFGAASEGGKIFVYGGQMEGAHQYHRDSQSGDLWMLDLSSEPTAWKKLGQGKRVQGMAMVAHQGRLIRAGGLEARNAKGEEDDLVSSPEVVAWNVAKAAWEPLADLPIGQSSHCMAVAGDELYCVGGWMMHGKDGGEEWHEGGWRLDLSSDAAKWVELPPMEEPRRALALVASAKYIWAIGGMAGEGPVRTVERLPIDESGKPTGQWESVAPLPKPDENPMASMEGFGCAATLVGSVPVVTTISGTVWRWDEKAADWKKQTTFDPPRFFHELVRTNDATYLVGGTSMTTGHDVTVKPIKLDE